MKEKTTCGICGYRFEKLSKTIIDKHECKIKDKVIYAIIKPRDSIIEILFYVLSFYLWFETGIWFWLLLIFGGSFITGFLKGWFKLG